MNTKVGAMVSQIEQRIIDKVTKAREDADLSRKDVARALGIEEQSYGHYERGRFAFTVEQLLILSRVLRRPVTWFLGLPSELSQEEERLVHLWRMTDDKSIRRIAIGMLEEAAKISNEED